MRCLLLVAIGSLYLSTTGCKPAQPASSTAASSSDAATSGPKAVSSWDKPPTDQQPNASDLMVLPFPSDKLTDYLVPANNAPGAAGNGMPRSLDGIWWTDGDTLPIVALTLSHAYYYGKDDPKNKLIILPVYGAQTYTYQGGIGRPIGEAFFNMMRDMRLYYEIRLNDDEKFGTIVPVVTVYGQQVRIPTWMAEFTMEYMEDGLWNRKSSFFGIRVWDYKFTRIINADGTQVHSQRDAFKRYMDSAMYESLMICSTNKELASLGCKDRL